MALVAEVFVDGRETVIAEARYVRRDDPHVAEFAVSVAEPWQGRKLAALLLGKLLHRAAAAGIRRIVGETLTGNLQMLALARKSGFSIVPSSEVRGLMLLERSLRTPWDPPATTAARHRWLHNRPHRCGPPPPADAGWRRHRRSRQERKARARPIMRAEAAPSAAVSNTMKTSTGAKAHTASAVSATAEATSQRRRRLTVFSPGGDPETPTAARTGTEW